MTIFEVLSPATIDRIVSLDSDAFLSIHHGMANNVFDMIMPILRNKLVWIPLYLFFAIYSIWKYKAKGIFYILGAAAAVFCADQFAAGFMKPMFERLRPCNDPFFERQIRQLVHCGSGYSFISAHATNHFALAIYFSWFFKHVSKSKTVTLLFLTWAASISFAQVYVGVHYPLDVIAGALAGCSIGLIIVVLMQKFAIK